MLFWTKLLTIAHSITSSVHPFLPLYYALRLKFEVLTISILTAVVLTLRVPSSALWTDFVDQRSQLHGLFTALLTAIGTAGLLFMLSVPPTWIAVTLPVAVVASVLDGIFYQPLLILVDSAIVKILGDYKILHASERQYGKIVSAGMAVIIGWFLDDDHDFDTLMVTSLIGSVILFLLSLSTSVQAADPTLLDIPEYQEIDETSPLIKHASNQTETNITSVSYVCYKPYSLFGERLSHISEEDANMLQRMATTDSVSIKPAPKPASVHSNTHLSFDITPNRTTYRQCPPPLPTKSHNHFSTHDNLVREDLPPSFELARLPYPPPEAPAVVLMTLYPGYYQNRTYYSRNPLQQPPPLLPIQPQQIEEECYYLQCSPTTHYQQQSKWIFKSFMCSLFCLGMVYGMTQTLVYLYLHNTLMLPMHTVGLVGLTMIVADFLASRLAIQIVRYFQLSVVVACAHIILVVCALIYTWLQSTCFCIEVFVIILQCFQGISFHLLWSLAAHQVDSVILTDHKRLMLKGGMAAFYSSLGPAIGMLFMGYLVQTYDNNFGYTLVYQYAAGLTILSAILSWEWSTTD